MHQVLIHHHLLKNDIANLKAKVDKLDIEKLEKLENDRLAPVLIDLIKLCDVAKMMLLKR